MTPLNENNIPLFYSMFYRGQPVDCHVIDWPIVERFYADLGIFQ